MTGSQQAPSLLLCSGMAELAAGALSGWVYTRAKTRPDEARRLGLKNAARVRQWHLDLAMLGTATVACEHAVPDPPRVVATALGIGAWTNAMGFLPLAVNPDLEDHPAFVAAMGASFCTTSVGFTGMAATLARHRLRQSKRR